MKASWVARSRLFCIQVAQEVRRVVWPTRRDVVLTSIVVFVLAFIFSIFLTLVDRGVITMLSGILGIFND